MSAISKRIEKLEGTSPSEEVLTRQKIKQAMQIFQSHNPGVHELEVLFEITNNETARDWADESWLRQRLLAPGLDVHRWLPPFAAFLRAAVKAERRGKP